MSDRYRFRVTKNFKLDPADAETLERVKKAGRNAALFGDFRKPRNPQFHRLMHALGGLAVENLAEFEDLDAHGALKRLQTEADVECDRMAIFDPQQPSSDPRGAVMEIRAPRSLSFASMDEEKFREVSRAICHRLTAYWPDCSIEDIWAMAHEWMRRAA